MKSSHFPSFSLFLPLIAGAQRRRNRQKKALDARGGIEKIQSCTIRTDQRPRLFGHGAEALVVELKRPLGCTSRSPIEGKKCSSL